MSADLPRREPAPIADFAGLIAVVTGGGSGIGRELVLELARLGADVALCDLRSDGLAETVAAANAVAAKGVRLTSAVADVARRSDVDEFARHVAAEFRTDAVHLLFNNAGTTGGHSIVRGAEANWDRTFDVVWGGVLNGTRAFFPLLEAAQRSQVVNIASINATWGCLGAQGPHTAYCTAKFAVRGFTEALIVDFRVNAPHVTAAVVLPGHVATPIARRALESAGSESGRISDEYVARTRQSYASRGRVVDSLSDDDVRTLIMERIERFEQSAPTSAAEAATAILQGVRDGEWRIVVGPDAHAIDEAVRANPTAAYSQEFTDALTAKGHFVALVEPR